jgi:hypothetical protein
MQFAAVHESLVGTKRTSGDVSFLVAIGGKADVARTTYFGRVCRVARRNFTPGRSQNRA